MATTLLAVDDSVTMRKVLEITFASPEFRVVVANSADVALQRFKSDRPDLVISDITLEPKNGYELCKALKQLSPATPVLLLSSKQSPFDTSKGNAAQADDHMDKPFDTQQMIDKVKKMLSIKGDTSQVIRPPLSAAQPLAGAQPHAQAPAPQPAPTMASPAMRPAMTPEVKAPVPVTAPAAGAAAAPARAKTLIYNPPSGTQPAVAAQPAVKAPAPTVTTPGVTAKPGLSTSTTPPGGLPRQRTVAIGPTASASPGAVAPSPQAAVTAAVNGQMAGKLEGMGLTQAQIEGVLALSRDIVERVVWEVVPVLAETMIKEELARLTK